MKNTKKKHRKKEMVINLFFTEAKLFLNCTPDEFKMLDN